MKSNFFLSLCFLIAGFILISSYVFAGGQDIIINDVILLPEEVKTGRALLISIKIEYIGTTKYTNVAFKVNIPKFGLTASTYIDELKTGDKISSEELYVRIPTCVEPGEYKINIEVTYGNNKVTEERTINILDGGTCDDTETNIEAEEIKVVKRISIPPCPSICGRNSSSGECICPPNYGFCFDNVGLRDILNDTEVYCDKGLWQEQKEDNQICKNSFECSSNFCSKGYCYDIYLEVEETKSILQRILGWLKSIFNLEVR